MNLKYVLQQYEGVSKDKGGRWATTKVIRRRISFVILTALASRRTKKDRVPRRILLYPRGTKLFAVSFGTDGKYWEGFTGTGTKIRDAELKAKERASMAGEDVDDDEGDSQQLEQDIAYSQRIADRKSSVYDKRTNRLERAFGNVPCQYRCLVCHLVTATAGKRSISSVRCEYCGSDRVKRIK